MPSEPAIRVASHFDSVEQQRDTITLGMWVFLATEIMFFGGAFAAYCVYRHANQEAFHAASRQLDIIAGAINTLVLLTSSLTMALAVAAAAENNRKRTILYITLTFVLGAAFLGIKAVEYAHKLHEHHFPLRGFEFIWPGELASGAHLFFSLYFAMTGLHALHMIIGLGVLAVFLAMVVRARNAIVHADKVAIMGLYWHFVDMIWVYLFPLLYLIDRT
jgi:cytochrome c oxidase subunit 3